MAKKETVTLPKEDFEKMVELIRKANILLSIANKGLVKIEQGVVTADDLPLKTEDQK